MPKSDNPNAPVIRWLGPYPPREDNDMTGFRSKQAAVAARHADFETMQHIIDLRRESEALKVENANLNKALDIANRTTINQRRALEDILDFYDNTLDTDIFNNIETLIRLRGAIIRSGRDYDRHR
jgi:hypothetical protein